MTRHAVPLLLALLLAAAPLHADPEPRRGMFLLATPQLQHPLWKESVILLLEHGPGGTLGVILNRPLDLPLGDLAEGLPGVDPQELALYLGGPVARHEPMWLLRSPRPDAGGLEVVPGVTWGRDHSVLAERLRAGAGGELRVMVGHAGWAPGQLEDEIARGDWRLLPADAESIFDLDSATQWQELMQRRGQRWVRLDTGADG